MTPLIEIDSSSRVRDERPRNRSRLQAAAPSPEPGLLADMRRLGRLEAEAFDAALRDDERCEREERLTRLAAGDESAYEPAGGFSSTGSGHGGDWRLRIDHERLAEFYHAVLRSKGWRLLQAARRLVGREW